MEATTSNHRKSKRNQLLLNLAFFDEDQNNRGEIVNLSSLGALIQFNKPLDTEEFSHLHPGDHCPIQTWLLLNSGELCKMTLDADIRWIKQTEDPVTHDISQLVGIDFSQSLSSQRIAEDIINEIATVSN